MAKAKQEAVEETSNLPVSMEDEIRKQLAQQKDQIGALPSNKIALKAKKFTLPDGQSSPGPIEVIIVDFNWFMVHYPGSYNANNPQQPDCFAVGREKPDGGQLRPHENVVKPYSETCKDCPKNEWKSAPTGNGKACKNQRRLIVIPPDFDDKTEPMTMYVSPGGLKNFDAYVSRLSAEHGILPVQCITEVSFDADQSYPLLQFKYLDRHTKVNEAWAIRERAQSLLFRPVEIDDEKK